MSLTKIITASVLSLAACSVYAGGPENEFPGGPPALHFGPFIYLGASVGWAYSDWRDFILGSGAPGNVHIDTNGFTYGGKLGYQATDHVGIEGGGFQLPDSDESAGSGADEIHGKITSWFVYVAGTMRIAVFDPNLHIMGKLGGAYRSIDHTGLLNEGVGQGSYGTVMFGAGLNYDLQAYNLPLSVGVDYIFVPATSARFLDFDFNTDKNTAPAAQLAVADITYHFGI